MQKRTKIKIDFGTPNVGWLPMNFQYGDFELTLNISRIPLDPIPQLLEALLLIHKGMPNPSKIIWHLEPKCYYFQLEKIDNQFIVKIFESAYFESPMQIVETFTGEYEDIILPLYRGLKKFSSGGYKEPHWGVLAEDKVVELTSLVKRRKTSH